MGAPDGEAAIEARALGRRYGALVAVDALDLVVPFGRIVGLLGPNGAGKSTVLKMLTTLLPPTSGTARVAGFDVVRDAVRVRERIGYVPQLVSADGALTGRENLAFAARLHGVPDRARRIDEALARIGLTGVADALVRTYSGGMVRRLELAQALLHGPRVVFLDEPTVGLDPLARRGVWEQLEALRRDGSVAVLLTTHDLEEARHLCDEVAILHRGRLVARGAPAELERALGPQATLGDVFAAASGGALEAGGRFADVQQARRTATRLG